MVDNLQSNVSTYGFKQFLDSYSGEVEQILTDTAFVIHDEQVRTVPVDTGDLRSTIHVEQQGPIELSVVEGNEKIDYGPYVEYGTEHQPAQPHARPAAEKGNQYRYKRYQELASRYK